jgi:hypothetical protein
MIELCFTKRLTKPRGSHCYFWHTVYKSSKYKNLTIQVQRECIAGTLVHTNMYVAEGGAVFRIREYFFFFSFGSYLAIFVANEKDLLSKKVKSFFWFFGVKILKFFDEDPGSRMEKSQIRDPG